MATITGNPSGTNVIRLVLTANITFNLNAGYDGQLLTVIFQQDGTGGRTVTAGTNVSSVGTIASTANEDTLNLYLYDALLGIWGYIGQVSVT